jgi:heterotetrameric sarcosine oxidase delta subunit
MRIHCPCCGPRDEAEFSFRGDASVSRPAADAGVEAFAAYLYDRSNPKGWTVEWFQHATGCRQWLRVKRHTVTHAIGAVAKASETIPE